jgi:hypothetical protein
MTTRLEKVVIGTSLLLLIVFFIAHLVSGAANLMTHCSADGNTCVPNCSRAQPQHKDEPCWLITSPNSDWEPPLWGFRIVDYRENALQK